MKPENFLSESEVDQSIRRIYINRARCICKGTAMLHGSSRCFHVGVALLSILKGEKHKAEV